MENNDVYVSRMHPEDAKILDQLTKPKNWDFAQFRKVLIAIGKVGNGQAVPAPNRPDSIHLQGLRQYIDELIARTTNNGREHARCVFVDTGRNSLVIGKITVGTATETRLDTTREPGREKFQRLIGSFHTHPSAGASMTAHGLSGPDYRIFLSDPKQQIMMVAYGVDNRIMVMKTSVTPNNLSKEAVDRRVKDCEQENLNVAGKHPIQQVVNFNKAICIEFGLIMYVADQKSRDLFTRVEVTK